MFFALFALALVVIAVPAAVLRPHWVFYMFIGASAFGRLFYGYIDAVGNLGAPRTWQPSDLLFPLLLVAAFFQAAPRWTGSNVVRTSLLVMAVMSAFALAQGLVLHTTAALAFGRQTFVLAAILFGLRYLTTYRRVEALLRFIVLILMVTFVLHMLVRFAIYVPPTAEIEYETQLGGSRGTLTLLTNEYMVLLALGTARLVTKVRSRLMPAVMITVAAVGVMLSETRSLWASLAVMLMTSLLFVKGRAKAVLLYGLAGMLAMIWASVVGFDFMSRFRLGDATLMSQAHSWRGMEYTAIAECYEARPYLILTGRGCGALHAVPWSESSVACFFHSDYLGWLDRSGLLGLGAFVFMLAGCLWRSFWLVKSTIPLMRCYGITCFLLMVGVSVQGLAFPMFSDPHAAPTLCCFAVIVANWRLIHHSMAEANPGAAQQMAYDESLIDPGSGGPAAFR